MVFRLTVTIWRLYAPINFFTPLVIFIARYYYLRYSKNGEYKVDRLFYLSPQNPYKLDRRPVYFCSAS